MERLRLTVGKMMGSRCPLRVCKYFSERKDMVQILIIFCNIFKTQTVAQCGTLRKLRGHSENWETECCSATHSPVRSYILDTVYCFFIFIFYKLKLKVDLSMIHLSRRLTKCIEFLLKSNATKSLRGKKKLAFLILYILIHRLLAPLTFPTSCWPVGYLSIKYKTDGWRETLKAAFKLFVIKTSGCLNAKIIRTFEDSLLKKRLLFFKEWRWREEKKSSNAVAECVSIWESAQPYSLGEGNNWLHSAKAYMSVFSGAVIDMIMPVSCAFFNTGSV